MQRLPLSAIAALFVFLPLDVSAEPDFFSAKQLQDKAYGDYPLVSTTKPVGPICYMEMEGYRMDLSLLCGPAEAEGSAIAGGSSESSSSAGGFSTNSDSRSSRSSSSAGGPCDRPEQLDSAGRRCGKRAASERAGGR